MGDSSSNPNFRFSTSHLVRSKQQGLDESLFWPNFYKLENESGGLFISGWIILWFPYIQNRDGTMRENIMEEVHGFFPQPGPIKGLKDIKLCGSLTDSCFPSGLSAAPFKWQYYNQQYEMEFIAGFTSYTQDKETLAVRPKIGWAVREKPSE